MGKSKKKKPEVFDATKQLIINHGHPVLTDSRLDSIMLLDTKSFPEVISLMSEMIKENPEFSNVVFDVVNYYDGSEIEFFHRRMETDEDVAARKKIFDDRQAELARIETVRKEKEDAAHRQKEKERKDALDAKNRQEYEQYLLLKEKFGGS